MPLINSVNYNTNKSVTDSNANESQLSEGNIKTIFDSLPTPVRKISNEIKWISARQVPSLKIFKTDEFGYTREASAKYYKVGEFLDGKYKGGDLILISAGFDGPAFYPGFYRFAKKGNELVFLEKHSDGLYDGDGFDREKFLADEEYSIPDLEYPKLIKGPKVRQYLQQDEYVRDFMSLSKLKIAYIDQVFGNVYTTDDVLRGPNSDTFTRNGFYIEAPDGTVIVYSLKFDFIDKKNVPEITWNDKTKNDAEYTYADMTGCGSRDYMGVRPTTELAPETNLEVIGKNSKGDPIYGFKDKNHGIIRSFYDSIYDSGDKPSYEVFTQNHPIFYWVDPFGRYVEFKSNKFVPSAECAKPVIYLYPENPAQVSVKISPKGGLTKSEPFYDGAWEVSAEPDGQLTEIKTGKIYPYLFWEGRGAIYEQPDKGFTVKKENIHSFLIEKLTQLGLNEKEQADFMEFWEPKMQDAPYYFVTFLGNWEMDQIAPLEISPKPDTVIRVLMDFSPLNQPIKSQEYNIKTPKRTGFTAVEWGGVTR